MKLNRPWGDQSGGARKWAIRDGCQNSFQMGSPTWTLPPRFLPNAQAQQAAKLKAKAQSRTMGKSKALALGRGEESPDRELSPFDDTNGPSNGNAWDPDRDPHPWINEPAYQAHLAKRKQELALNPEEPRTPPNPQYYPPNGYSLSPVSPYSYNHEQYMSSGGWHPAYSPEPYPAAYHDTPAPSGTANPSHLSGASNASGSGASGASSSSQARSYPDSHSSEYHTPQPQAYPYYGGYGYGGCSQPALYPPNSYPPVSPTAATYAGPSGPPQGYYWNNPYRSASNGNFGSSFGSSGPGFSSQGSNFSPPGPGFGSSMGNSLNSSMNSSFASSNGGFGGSGGFGAQGSGGPGGNGNGGPGGPGGGGFNSHATGNNSTMYDGADEDSPLTEIPTPEFKTEP